VAYPIQISLVDVKPWVKPLGDILNAGIVEPISLPKHGFESPTGSDHEWQSGLAFVIEGLAA